MNRFRRVSTGWQRKKKGNEIHFKPTPSTLAVGGVVSDNEVFVQLSLSLSLSSPTTSQRVSLECPLLIARNFRGPFFSLSFALRVRSFFCNREPVSSWRFGSVSSGKKKGLPIDYFIFWVPSFFSLSLSLSLSSISSLRFPSSPFFNFLLGELESGHLIRPLFVDAILAWLESQGRRFDARTCRSIRRFGSCTSARF